MQTDTPPSERHGRSKRRIEETRYCSPRSGVPEFIDLIRQGKIVASGMQQPYLLGVRSAQAMFDHLDGKTPPKEILVPIIVVSQKNLDEADDDLQMS